MDQIEFVSVAYTAYGGAWSGPLAKALEMSENTVIGLGVGKARITRRVASAVVYAAGAVIAERALMGFDEHGTHHHRSGTTIRVAQGRDEAERVTSRLIAKGLRKRGYRVEIVAPLLAVASC